MRGAEAAVEKSLPVLVAPRRIGFPLERRFGNSDYSSRQYRKLTLQGSVRNPAPVWRALSRGPSPNSFSRKVPGRYAVL